MPDINEVTEQFKAQVTEFRAYVERELAEVKKNGHAAPETKAALDKLTAAIEASETRYNEMKGRVEHVEEKLGRPGSASTSKAEGKSIEEKAYEHFLRGGREALSPEESKAMSVAPDSQGGYWVVPQRMASIIPLLVQASPMRQICNVIPLSSNQLEWPKENAVPTPLWVAEQGTRVETAATAPAGLEIIPAHELYAEVYATNQMIEDSAIPVESYIEGVAVRIFAKGEGTKFISGNGVGCPMGILSYDITAVAQGEASTFTSGDGVIDLIHALPTAYAAGARLIMNRATLGAIRKVKGGDGHYIWWGDYTGANPPNIVGIPYTEMPDMPDIAANSYPIVFGNFALGYVIADRIGISLLRDPYTSTAGSVKFKYRKRVGGACVLTAAFRKLKIASTV